jgi:sugar phosphate isomerase/epimerase
MKIAITATPGEAPRAPILLRGDIAAAFRKAAEAGCDGVELHLRRAEDVDPAVVRRLVCEFGLGVPTLGTGMAVADGLSFADPDPEVRARAVERVLGHVRLAAAIGSAVTIGSLSGRLGSRPGALQCLSDICRAAEPLGVIVLLEPLNRYECDYINTVVDGLRIMDEVGAPNLRLLADTFHMNIEETDMAASLEAAGQRLGHVHLADSNRRAPGHGHFDFAGVFAALARIGYSGYLSLEVLPLPDAATAIRDGVAAIRGAGARALAGL